MAVFEGGPDRKEEAFIDDKEGDFIDSADAEGEVFDFEGEFGVRADAFGVSTPVGRGIVGVGFGVAGKVDFKGGIGIIDDAGANGVVVRNMICSI